MNLQEALVIWIVGILRFLTRSPKHKNKIYAIEVHPGSEGESGVYQSAISPSSLIETYVEDVTTLYELMKFAAQKYARNNCMGWREVVREHKEQREVTKKEHGKEIKEKKPWTLYEMSEYKWMNYQEFADRVQHIASGLVSDQVGLSPGSDSFGIFCNTCPEWMMLLHACSSQSITISTIYANLGEEGLQHVINQGKISHLFTSEDLFHVVANVMHNCPTLKVIIYKDKPEQKYIDEISNKGHIKLISIQSVEDVGKHNPAKPKPPKPTDKMMIMYTSGTTGNPKGVIILHKNLIAVIASGFKCIEILSSDVYIAFLPLAHVLELVIENALLMAGASLGYSSARTLTASNMKNCKGDLKELRPTIMAGVPEVWERIRRGAMEKLKKRPLVKKVFENAVKFKQHLIPYFGFQIPGLDLLFKQFRSETGNNLRLILSGGAPISEDTQKFLRACFSINCIQGYGLTETCGVITLQLPDDYSTGVVGAPVPCTETKLVDIPEMGYTTKDKPFPRGELLARGVNITEGYFNNEEETNKVYSSDGWFYTGDVGQLMPNGTYKIVDRKKNLVKLAHGEYIPLEHLESVYKHSDLVENICVYGDSSKNYLVAIVVPHKANLEGLASKKGVTERDFHALCKSDQVVNAVLSSLKEVGKKNKLPNVEIVRGCYITSDEWTTENDMLTAAFKTKRRNIISRYEDQIKELYKDQ